MKRYRLALRPLTPFGTPLAGDTLFGHLCWAATQRRGESGLADLLAGYTDGRPWAVLSDAFPAGTLPRPTLPVGVAGLDIDPRDRKALKAIEWLPADECHLPVAQWIRSAAADGLGGAPEHRSISRVAVTTRNTINRLTGTTGRDQFAPRQIDQICFGPDVMLDLYAVLDEQRMAVEEFRVLLADVGRWGFGRDASTGLGKFTIEGLAEVPEAAPSRHAMALAPCAFDPGVIDPDGCWWLPVTRFGRHGGTAALGGGGGPFKRPLMLARTGAVIRWRQPCVAIWHGSGLGGTRQPISAAIPATVHQGYAPLVSINVEEV